MKVWLDDERPAPDGWVICKTAGAAIEFLSTLPVKEISLDHDLGEEETGVGNGYEVLQFLEEMQFLDPKFVLPEVIKIHTANPVARKRMQQCLEAIERRQKKNDERS